MEEGVKANSEKEQKRAAALTRLKSSLPYLAATYLVEEDKGLGEFIKESVHNQLYEPSLQSGVGGNLLYSLLKKSRIEGKRLSGSVSEYQIVKFAFESIRDTYLQNITVEDALALMGYSSLELDEKYAGKVIEELDGDLKGTIVEHYLDHLKLRTISDALALRDRISRGTLVEKLISEEQKRKIEEEQKKLLG